MCYIHIRGDDMPRRQRRTQTSTQVKQRYKDKTYKRYQVYLKIDEDRSIIEWVDTHKDSLGTTNIFRDALECYINQEKD